MRPVTKFLRAHAPLALFNAARSAKRTVYRALGVSYHNFYCDRASRLLALRGAKVLVVGANAGGDCALLIDRGAAEVHGIDVIDEVGGDFQHERVRYHKMSIENAGLPSGYFDLVFAIATMEHVNDIKAGFAEMEGLARPGGVIFSVSAPLWRSPYGHHMGCFEGHPWVHLVFERDALVSYAKSHGIAGERGHPIEDIVDYMLNPAYFNMIPSRQYVEACSELRSVLVKQNDLASEPKGLLEHALGRQALECGYLADDLLTATHTFIARKM